MHKKEFSNYFNLYLNLYNPYTIQKQDIYNIDKKNNALKTAFAIKVFISIKIKAVLYLTTIH